MIIQKITPQKVNNPYFEGMYKIKNRNYFPTDLLQAVEQAPFLRGMTRDKDVVIRLISEKVDPLHSYLTGDKRFYNLSFSVLPEGSSWERIKDLLHMKKRHRISSVNQSKTDLIYFLSDPAHIASLKRRCQ